MISGKRSWEDSTPVAGQQFEYAFDDIGNRTSTGVGGDGSGAGLRPAAYQANHLNQYTSRTVPGAVDILGIANPTAPVTVNAVSANRQVTRTGLGAPEAMPSSHYLENYWLGLLEVPPYLADRPEARRGPAF